MKFTCVDPVEYLYPDITRYKSGTDKIDILAARGSYACAQILFSEAEGPLQISCEGWEPEVYEMVAIPVETNERMTEENSTPFSPARKAPFYVYDCLKPCKGEILPEDGVAAVYLSWKISEDAKPGIVEGCVKAGDVTIPVAVEISSAVVPTETLPMILGYNRGKVCEFHNVEIGTSEFEAMDTAYLSLLRRMRQNGLYGMPHVKSIEKAPNEYEFDFTEFAAYMEKAYSLGYKYMYHMFGHRVSWQKSTILVGDRNLPSMSYEGFCYMAQFLPALSAFLEKRGWMDKFVMSLLDEPREVNYLEYRALCSIVRKYAPKIRLIDAVSCGEMYGSIDIYIPLSNEYAEHQEVFETYRKYGDEVWYYDCVHPRGNGYINRFMDDPLLTSRYHGWANYAYDLRGYLHWATNAYQPGQDPFKQSCPEHRNTDSVCILPPGDTHLLYPGTDGPWMSVRFENFRAGTEEFEMLKKLAETDKELADEICGTVFHSFTDVEYDPAVFRAVRNKLIRALEK